MPRATVSQDSRRFELKSLSGAFVELRTLSFHEMNSRQEIAGRMYQEAKVDTRKKGRKQQRPEQETIRGYFEIMNVAVTEFEFRNCITDHNLEDENGELIDFTRPMQAWRLDPKVGAEISKYISELIELEEDDEDELVPLVTPPFSSSPIEATT